MADVNDEIRREAMGYESKEDTARRMGGHGIPTAREYKRPTGPILWTGRVVFGILSLLSLGVFLYGRYHGIEPDAHGMRVGLTAFGPCVLLFLLTFVRRAF
jgi:hypothetical protein